uniref:Uncharacterized protein n=1 Tax=Knipowitschia caucasica TaxID=637954 RepID=A0AAV2LBK8_KNICA
MIQNYKSQGASAKNNYLRRLRYRRHWQQHRHSTERAHSASVHGEDNNSLPPSVLGCCKAMGQRNQNTYRLLSNKEP